MDIHVGSQRTSLVQVKDISNMADVLAIMIPPVYLGEYENLGNIACHVEKTDKVMYNILYTKKKKAGD